MCAGPTPNFASTPASSRIFPLLRSTNHALPFEEAGGHVAWVFGAAAGWPVERRRRAAEVILRHMWDEVDVAEDPEGHLLELSTGMDISGRRTEDIPPNLRADVLARYPRLGLGVEFVGYFKDQAERKPLCLAAKFVPAASPRGSRLTPWTAKPGVSNRKSGPNQSLQQTAAAILVSRSLLFRGSAAAAELHR